MEISKSDLRTPWTSEKITVGAGIFLQSPGGRNSASLGRGPANVVQTRFAPKTKPGADRCL
jgi:hypothetical protein